MLLYKETTNKQYIHFHTNDLHPCQDKSQFRFSIETYIELYTILYEVVKQKYRIHTDHIHNKDTFRSHYYRENCSQSRRSMTILIIAYNTFSVVGTSNHIVLAFIIS